MAEAVEHEAAETSLAMQGDSGAILKLAIDNWIDDQGQEEHELRDRLLEVKQRL